MPFEIQKPVLRQFLSFLLLLSAAFHPAAAQAPAPPATEESEETFYDTFDVSVVNVDVFVTDRQGNRVTGLTRDDFQILEDGKPVEITNFYAAEATAAAPAPGPNPGAGGRALPDALQEVQSLQLAVYVDTTNLSSASGQRLRKSLEEFLASRAGEQILIASYGGADELKVRPVDTADPRAVAAAVGEVFTGLPGQPHRVMQLRQLLRETQLGKDPTSVRSDADWSEVTLDEARISASVESYVQQVQRDAEVSIGALDHFLNGLAGLPGRKAVLHVSGGLPIHPGEAMGGAVGKKYWGYFRRQFDGRSQTDLEARLRQVEERANANRITLYGLGQSDNVAPNYGWNPYGLWAHREEESERSGLARSLDEMALPTGGLADLNAVNPGALLGQMGQDLDSYYSLGYTPAHRRPGTTHALKVKVKRPDLVVRHRQSYRDRTPAEVLADRTVSALYFGTKGNPLELAVQIDGEGELEKDQQKVKLTLKMPFSKLVVLPQGNVHQGRLQVAVAVRDAAGRTSKVTTFEVPVRIPNDRLQEMFSQTVGYETRLAMRSVEHVVAVSVRDELGNLSSTVTTTWAPPAGGACQTSSR